MHALLACELVYIKDPYGEKLYRMNTVFKLYLQSWLLLSIAAPWCWAQLLDRKWCRRHARDGVVTVGGVLLASCAYPIGVTTTRAVHRMAPLTLDGNEYLQREHPDDFAAIQWMRDTSPISRSSWKRPAIRTRTTRASRATPACRR